MYTCILKVKSLQSPLQTQVAERPVGITISSIQNVQIIDTIPKQTFQINSDVVIALSSQDWYHQGLSAKLLLNSSEAHLQLVLHPHSLFETGISAEITTFQTPITKRFWTFFDPSTELKQGVVIHFNLAKIVSNLQKANSAFREAQLKAFEETERKKLVQWAEQTPRNNRTPFVLKNETRIRPFPNVNTYRQLEYTRNQQREEYTLSPNRN